MLRLRTPLPVIPPAVGVTKVREPKENPAMHDVLCITGFLLLAVVVRFGGPLILVGRFLCVARQLCMFLVAEEMAAHAAPGTYVIHDCCRKLWRIDAGCWDVLSVHLEEDFELTLLLGRTLNGDVWHYRSSAFTSRNTDLCTLSVAPRATHSPSVMPLRWSVARYTNPNLRSLRKSCNASSRRNSAYSGSSSAVRYVILAAMRFA